MARRVARTLSLASAIAVTACRAPAPPPAAPPQPRWIVDPREPGPSRPPVGRSLFDTLVAAAGAGGAVPFPFEALVAAVERTTGRGGIALVLVPRGRSLQRDASAPDFFAFPRAVLAATADAPDRKLADRLFVAYHERAAVLEVVSYNEEAGRFEFQVVRDYRADARPRVAYASRELCTACHQNGGPIFARPLWDETNASPDIAARLGHERASFYGIPVRADVDAAYAIDNATDRGGMLAAYQLLWGPGCGDGAAGARCRAALLGRVLAHRLGDSATAGPGVPEAVGRSWSERLPHGLLLPTADLPNRLPLRDAGAFRRDARSVPALRSPEARTRLEELLRFSDVPEALEPLQPRAPAETWAPSDLASATLGARVAAGLATFLTDDDARRLDDRLAALGGPTAVRSGTCAVAGSGRAQVAFACGGGADGFALTGRVRGRAAAIDSVSFEGVQETAALRGVADWSRSGAQQQLTLALRSGLTGRRARRADGSRVDRIVLRWRGSSGTAALTVVDDLAGLRAALASLPAGDALAEAPFRRTRIMGALERALDLPGRCCAAGPALPPAEVDGETRREADAADPLATLRRYCGRCHDTPDRFPPNFLHGPDAPARVSRCAERIAFRLEMWTLPAGTRPKTPMPPPSALRALDLPVESWPAHPDLAALRRAAEAHLAGPPASPADYASLPPCLAEAPEKSLTGR